MLSKADKQYVRTTFRLIRMMCITLGSKYGSQAENYQVDFLNKLNQYEDGILEDTFRSDVDRIWIELRRAVHTLHTAADIYYRLIHEVDSIEYLYDQLHEKQSE